MTTTLEEKLLSFMLFDSVFLELLGYLTRGELLNMIFFLCQTRCLHDEYDIFGIPDDIPAQELRK